MDSVSEKLSTVALDTESSEQSSCQSKDGDSCSANGAKEEVNGGLSVKMWWEDMSGKFKGLSVDYLLDKSTPWCFEAFTHVLVENIEVADPKVKLSTSEEKKRREAIILVVSQRALEKATVQATESTATPLKLPRVRFVRDEIYITVDSPALLESLWRKPLAYGGKDLKFRYRGLPWGNVTVFSRTGGSSMTFEQADACCYKFISARPKAMINILASFYKVQGAPGESETVYTGDLLIFWSNFYQRTKPTFNHEGLKVVNYYTCATEKEDE